MQAEIIAIQMTFHWRCSYLHTGISWDWDGSITGLHSKNLAMIGLTGGSGKDVFCYLAMKIDNVTIVTTCRDIVMFFRLWWLLQLIYSRTLNANFLVSAVICGKSSGKTASFRCLPAETVFQHEDLSIFRPWVGCKFRYVDWPQLGPRRDQQVCCFCAVRTSPCWTGEADFPDKGTAWSKANSD